MTKRILIFGAGKIGRGFVGHLFFRSGYSLTFVDPIPSVVQRLNVERSYPLFVMGAPEKNEAVSGVKAVLTSSESEVIEAIQENDLFATAVGGANLRSVGHLLAKGLHRRFENGHASEANVIICENYKNPAAILRQAILSNPIPDPFRNWIHNHLGIVETQVLRSCIEPDEEMKTRHPLAIQVQDWWALPCDANAFRGRPPQCEGLRLKPNFQHELIRKLYTYNCSNATIAYLGYLKGYQMLFEAANDAEILEMTRQIYRESGQALIAEYHFDPREQDELQNLALSKYQDSRIPDPIERNARDTRRKLSPTDRLLGPANLVHKHGGTPKNLAIAIAAGLHYNGSNDEGTQHVQRLLKTQGLKAALREVCELSPDSKLAQLVQQAVPELQRFNRIGLKLVFE